MLQIGYLSLLDPHTRHGLSGINFYMFDALGKAEGVTLHFLGERFYAWPRRLRQLFRISDKARPEPVPLASAAPGSASSARQEAPPTPAASLKHRLKRLAVKRYVRKIRADIRSLDLDLIVAPFATTLITAIGADPGLPPILFTTDATPRFLSEAYGWETSHRVDLEGLAIRHSARVAYSSAFMAERARAEYADAIGAATEKVCVIPFGLNLDSVPERLEPKAADGRINLLFIGKEWERKGGPIALCAHRALRAAGARSSLVIIGCDPPDVAGHEAVSVIPNLDKDAAADRERYADLLRSAHFLILPSRADCTPMVIAEANAFGAPAIVSDVGGIPSLVTPDRNGYTLAVDQPGEAYAAVIQNIVSDSGRYAALSASSRREYDERLNWTVWAKEICRLGGELSRRRRQTSPPPGSPKMAWPSVPV